MDKFQNVLRNETKRNNNDVGTGVVGWSGALVVTAELAMPHAQTSPPFVLLHQRCPAVSAPHRPRQIVCDLKPWLIICIRNPCLDFGATFRAMMLSLNLLFLHRIVRAVGRRGESWDSIVVANRQAVTLI